MSELPLCRASVAATVLAAATPTVVVDGIEAFGASNFSLVIAETAGVNPITTVTIELSPNGSLYADVPSLTTAIGTIPAGGSKLISWNDLGPVGRIRITLTSALGATYALDLRGQ